MTDSTPSPRDWNADSYQRVAAPIEAMGLALLDRLDLAGDETVLDAGCGSGGLTSALVERVPRGRVIAVDGSPAMVQAARTLLGDQADVRPGDLTELELSAPVDAVFSSATFHWIADHDKLFARLFAALRPGGQLVAQCGAEGNVATVQAAVRRAAAEPDFAPSFEDWPGPWNFSSPELCRARLERAGFVDVQTGLHTVTVHPEDPREYLATVMLGSHLERLAHERRDAFVERVGNELARPLAIEYVRLTMTASRPG